MNLFMKLFILRFLRKFSDKMSNQPTKQTNKHKQTSKQTIQTNTNSSNKQTNKQHKQTTQTTQTKHKQTNSNSNNKLQRWIHIQHGAVCLPYRNHHHHQSQSQSQSQSQKWVFSHQEIKPFILRYWRHNLLWMEEAQIQAQQWKDHQFQLICEGNCEFYVPHDKIVDEQKTLINWRWIIEWINASVIWSNGSKFISIQSNLISQSNWIELGESNYTRFASIPFRTMRLFIITFKSLHTILVTKFMFLLLLLLFFARSSSLTVFMLMKEW